MKNKNLTWLISFLSLIALLSSCGGDAVTTADTTISESPEDTVIESIATAVLTEPTIAELPNQDLELGGKQYFMNGEVIFSVYDCLRVSCIVRISPPTSAFPVFNNDSVPAHVSGQNIKIRQRAREL